MAKIKRRRRRRGPREAELFLVALWQVLEHSQALQDRHGRCGACQLCEDVGGLLYLARMMVSLLEAEVPPFPELCARWIAQSKQEGHQQDVLLCKCLAAKVVAAPA